MKKKLAVFISGQGSNLSVFLQNKEVFESVLVVSSREEAYGLEKAKRFGVETLVLDKKVDWQRLNEELTDRKVDLVFLAGFMKIVPESFVDLWKGRLFNLHPSLLPKYKGLSSIERAYADKSPIGVSVHEVTAEVDAGKILFQEEALSVDDIERLSLEEAEFYTHVCEQKLVKKWINQWV